MALLLLEVQGEALRADHAVFADTGGEIPETYAYMEEMDDIQVHWL